MKFSATLLAAGKTATGFEVPPDVVESLGAGKIPPVLVTINGFTYRNTIAVLDGVYMIGVSAENRAGAVVSAGDVIEIDLQVDTEPRIAEVPDDFQLALNADDEARAFRRDLAQQAAKTVNSDWGRQNARNPTAPN